MTSFAAALMAKAPPMLGRKGGRVSKELGGVQRKRINDGGGEMKEKEGGMRRRSWVEKQEARKGQQCQLAMATW